MCQVFLLDSDIKKALQHICHYDRIIIAVKTDTDAPLAYWRMNIKRTNI